MIGWVWETFRPEITGAAAGLLLGIGIIAVWTGKDI